MGMIMLVKVTPKSITEAAPSFKSLPGELSYEDWTVCTIRNSYEALEGVPMVKVEHQLNEAPE